MCLLPDVKSRRLGRPELGPPVWAHSDFEKTPFWAHSGFEKKPDLGFFRFCLGPRLPKYVAAVNVSMWQPGSPSFDILAYVFSTRRPTRRREVGWNRARISNQISSYFLMAISAKCRRAQIANLNGPICARLHVDENSGGVARGPTFHTNPRRLVGRRCPERPNFIQTPRASSAGVLGYIHKDIKTTDSRCQMFRLTVATYL